LWLEQFYSDHTHQTGVDDSSSREVALVNGIIQGNGESVTLVLELNALQTGY